MSVGGIALGAHPTFSANWCSFIEVENERMNEVRP